MYRDNVIKVDNVFHYNNEKERKTILHLKMFLKTLLEELDRIKNKHNDITIEFDDNIFKMLKD